MQDPALWHPEQCPVGLLCFVELCIDVSEVHATLEPAVAK